MSCELIRVDFKKKSVKERKKLVSKEEKDVSDSLKRWLQELEDTLLMLHDDDGIALDNISVIVHTTDNPVLIPAAISTEALVESLEEVKQKFVKHMEELE